MKFFMMIIVCGLMVAGMVHGWFPVGFNIVTGELFFLERIEIKE